LNQNRSRALIHDDEEEEFSPLQNTIILKKTLSKIPPSHKTGLCMK
jgi:hypothetical protein